MTLTRRAWLLPLVGLAAAVGLTAWASSGRSEPTRERMRALLANAVVRLPALKSKERAVADPLEPNRPPRLMGERAAGLDWVSASIGSVPDTLFPKESDRVRKSPDQRGGINPCESPDPGFGIYDKWRWGGGAGKLLVPIEAVQGQTSVNTVFHFAGYELARKEVARSDAPFVFLGVAFAGAGLNYRSHVSGPLGLEALEKAVTASLERVPGAPTAIGHKALASWSAGYDAVGVVLEQSKNASEIDAVILLDGLHASRDDKTALLQLEPFIEFAKRAARGDAYMFVSYSSIGTDRYASTHETGRRLIRALGGAPLAVEREDAGGSELKEMFSKGNFHARGYKGGAELDHCAHLMLYPMALAGLERFWQSR